MQAQGYGRDEKRWGVSGEFGFLSVAAPLSVEVEFRGSVELLFNSVEKHQVTLPGQEAPWDTRNLLIWIKKNLLEEQSGQSCFSKATAIHPCRQGFWCWLMVPTGNCWTTSFRTGTAPSSSRCMAAKGHSLCLGPLGVGRTERSAAPWGPTSRSLCRPWLPSHSVPWAPSRQGKESRCWKWAREGRPAGRCLGRALLLPAAKVGEGAPQCGRGGGGSVWPGDPALPCLCVPELLLRRHGGSWATVPSWGRWMNLNSGWQAPPFSKIGNWSLHLSFPVWTAEVSACPPLILLWNPGWGPLFSADHPPSTHTAAAPPTTPLLLLHRPQPLALAHLSTRGPPDGLLKSSPWQKAAYMQLIPLGIESRSVYI